MNPNVLTDACVLIYYNKSMRRVTTRLPSSFKHLCYTFQNVYNNVQTLWNPQLYSFWSPFISLSFYPKRLTISAFNHEGTNPEQQESRKYNVFKKAKWNLSAPKSDFYISNRGWDKCKLIDNIKAIRPCLLIEQFYFCVVIVQWKCYLNWLYKLQ